MAFLEYFQTVFLPQAEQSVILIKVLHSQY